MVDLGHWYFDDNRCMRCACRPAIGHALGVDVRGDNCVILGLAHQLDCRLVGVVRQVGLVGDICIANNNCRWIGHHAN